MTEIEDCIVLASWCFSVFTVIYGISTLIKVYGWTKVNCWFCNTNFKVPYKCRNDWFCQNCQQYNGFDENGDYIKEIPEQFDEKLNLRSIPANPSGIKNPRGSHNGLCRLCNANEELKINQLAAFVPLREENYDKEIRQFQEKLEASYKLCKSCQRIVTKTIRAKTATTLKYLNQFDAKSNVKFATSTVKTKKIFMISLALFAFIAVVVALVNNKFSAIADILADFNTPAFYWTLSAAVCCLAVYSRMNIYTRKGSRSVPNRSSVEKERAHGEMNGMEERSEIRGEPRGNPSGHAAGKKEKTEENVKRNLCQQFGEINLGSAKRTFACQNEETPPSVQRNKKSSLLRPAKFNPSAAATVAMSRAVPTSSSGYESNSTTCSWNSKYPPAAVSEFDSISQVGLERNVLLYRPQTPVYYHHQYNQAAYFQSQFVYTPPAKRSPSCAGCHPCCSGGYANREGGNGGNSSYFSPIHVAIYSALFFIMGFVLNEFKGAKAREISS